MSNENQAKCPNCGERGGLTAKKDAYVNHSIAADGSVDWDDMSDVTTFDDTVYECMLCNETVEESEVESANGFEIK
jgi:DNA-directed RNA polymerase subunit RPC12/RpoP